MITLALLLPGSRLGAQQPYAHTRIRVGEHVFDALTAGPENGDLVLMLHGFPETSYTWRNQIPRLAAAGFRVVAPDQRGYSPGARPGTVDDYAMRYLVADVLGIADALHRERFHLVGHDWGGAVAWVVAARHPARVTSLVAVSMPHPAAFARARSAPESDQARRSSYFQDFAASDAEDRFLQDDSALLRGLFGGAGLSDTDVTVYAEALGSHEAMTAALNWYRALLASRSGRGGSGGGQPPAPRPPFEVPTVYIWGTKDPTFGREAAEATEDYVKGYYRFEVLDGVGHWVQEQEPERVTEIILEHLDRFHNR
jgi:pimeloyl-ACP methyl ester carboxylesterase